MYPGSGKLSLRGAPLSIAIARLPGAEGSRGPSRPHVEGRISGPPGLLRPVVSPRMPTSSMCDDPVLNRLADIKAIKQTTGYYLEIFPSGVPLDPLWLWL